MFGVGLFDCKNAWNLGNGLRSVVAFGGSLFIVQGNRWKNSGNWEKTDTEGARNKIPIFLGVDNMFNYIPYNCKNNIVAVELVKDATSILEFQHSENNFFIFGPEDGRLPDHVLDVVKHKIYLPTTYSLNLAACVACIGHDRMMKADQEGRQVCPTCGKSHIKWLENVSKWHCNACGHEWSVSI